MKYGKSLYPLKYSEHYANFHIFAKKISEATDLISSLRPRNHYIHHPQRKNEKPPLDHLSGKGNKYGVIICTGCGRKNDDEARFCKKCGKKLQSSFQSTGPVSSGPAPLERFENKRLPADAWASLKRMAEAWVYVLILAAVGAGCMIQETWWPLYPTVGLIGLIAWFRRI